MQQDVNDHEFMKKNNAIINKYGMCLLGPFSSMEAIHIIDALKGRVDYNCQLLIDGNDNYIMIRKYLKVTEDKFEENLKKAKNAYKKKNYLKALLYFNRLLQYDKLIPYVYQMIGEIYKNLHNYSIAIDFLTVANLTDFSQDNSEEISLLKSYINEPLPKPEVLIQEEEFKNDLTEYYGIENIESIIDLILSRVSLDDIWKIYKLDEEKRLLVFLILAKEYYALEMYEQGDEFLKIVEKDSNKTEFIKSELRIIKKNRKFYKNRREFNSHSFVIQENKDMKRRLF